MNNRNYGRKIAVRLFALRDFLYANADTEHAVTVDEIMEYYQSREFENTSIKTVYSDLHAIRGKEYEIDVAYDEKAKGWLLHNPPFEAYELRLIVDSIQSSKQKSVPPEKFSKSVTRFVTQKRENPRKHSVFGGFGGDYWTRTSGLMRVKHAL